MSMLEDESRCADMVEKDARFAKKITSDSEGEVCNSLEVSRKLQEFEENLEVGIERESERI